MISQVPVLLSASETTMTTSFSITLTMLLSKQILFIQVESTIPGKLSIFVMYGKIVFNQQNYKNINKKSGLVFHKLGPNWFFLFVLEIWEIQEEGKAEGDSVGASPVGESGL